LKFSLAREALGVGTFSPDEAHSEGEINYRQTRSSMPGQPKRMTNVLRKVIAIATLAINDKGGVVDNVVPSR